MAAGAILALQRDGAGEQVDAGSVDELVRDGAHLGLVARLDGGEGVVDELQRCALSPDGTPEHQQHVHLRRAGVLHPEAHDAGLDRLRHAGEQVVLGGQLDALPAQRVRASLLMVSMATRVFGSSIPDPSLAADLHTAASMTAIGPESEAPPLALRWPSGE